MASVTRTPIQEIPSAVCNISQELRRKIKSRQARVGIVGLGYVGLPLAVEFARSGYPVEILAGCGDRLVMFGCVDPGDSPVEPVDAVTDRVREALRYVEPERLLLAPDCGLMTITRDLARKKASVLSQAAREVRGGL